MSTSENLERASNLSNIVPRVSLLRIDSGVTHATSIRISFAYGQMPLKPTTSKNSEYILASSMSLAVLYKPKSKREGGRREWSLFVMIAITLAPMLRLDARSMAMVIKMDIGIR